MLLFQNDPKGLRKVFSLHICKYLFHGLSSFFFFFFQGALTHGDRRATESRDLSRFNIDNRYGRAALETVMKSVLTGEPGAVDPPKAYKGNFFQGHWSCHMLAPCSVKVKTFRLCRIITTVGFCLFMKILMTLARFQGHGRVKFSGKIFFFFSFWMKVIWAVAHLGVIVCFEKYYNNEANVLNGKKVKLLDLIYRHSCFCVLVCRHCLIL